MVPTHEMKEENNTAVLVHTQQKLQHLEGIKLYSILIGIMIATFLISLDVSVVATVRFYPASLDAYLT